MLFRRKTFAIAAVVTLSIALSGCSGGSAAAPTGDANCTPAHKGLQTIAQGKLTVAAYVSPPYTTEEKDGSIGGIDGIIVSKIAKMECLTLDAKSVAGAGLPATVESGRADMAIGGIYASPERAKTFSLTIPMYLDQAALLSRDGIDTIEGLAGKKLGVIQGYLWNTQFQAALGENNVVIYQTSAPLIADIKNGRIDAGAFTSSETELRAQEDPSLKSEVLKPTDKIPTSEQPNNVILLLNKKATPLTDALNADILTLIKDGTIAGALKKFGLDPSLVASPK